MFLKVFSTLAGGSGPENLTAKITIKGTLIQSQLSDQNRNISGP